MGRRALPPRLEKRGPVWRIIHGSLRISTSTDDEAKAKGALERYIAGLDNPLPPENPTIGDLLAKYADIRLRKARDRAAEAVRKRVGDSGQAVAESESARAAVKDLRQDEFVLKHLRRHLGNCRVLDVNSGLARTYMARRREESQGRKGRLADSTVIRELGILRAAIQWADKEDSAAWFSGRSMPEFEMPARGGEARQVWLTKDQARRLIDGATMPHVRLFLKIAFGSGARKEAIEALRWEMIRWETDEIDFGPVDHGKKRPLVKMGPALRADLHAAYAVRCSDWVIEYRGQRAGNIRNGIRAASEKAGIPFTAHIAKHSVVSWLVQAGKLTYSEIADLVDTTEATIRKHYAHLHPDNAAKFNDALELPTSVAEISGQ